MTTFTVEPTAAMANTVTVEEVESASTEVYVILMSYPLRPIRIEIDTSRSGEVVVSGERRSLRVADLGWSLEKAAQVRAQLAVFAEDWDLPGQDAYDEL